MSVLLVRPTRQALLLFELTMPLLTPFTSVTVFDYSCLLSVLFERSNYLDFLLLDKIIPVEYSTIVTHAKVDCGKMSKESPSGTT